MDSTQFLTLDEASVLAGTPKPTLRFWIRCGRIRGYRPGRRVLVERSELLAFLRSAQVVARPPSQQERRAGQCAANQEGDGDDGADIRHEA